MSAVKSRCSTGLRFSPPSSNMVGPKTCVQFHTCGLMYIHLIAVRLAPRSPERRASMSSRFFSSAMPGEDRSIASMKERTAAAGGS